MKQVLSDRQTKLVQFGLSIPVYFIILWGVYEFGIAWNVDGILGWGEVFLWNVASAFVSLSVVGVAMMGLNLIFYKIQVYRHGGYVDNVADSSE
ncbi:MAG: hypothetical protein ABEI52_07160 [Halobacteriaceae archaeon]